MADKASVTKAADPKQKAQNDAEAAAAASKSGERRDDGQQAENVHDLFLTDAAPDRLDLLNANLHYGTGAQGEEIKDAAVDFGAFDPTADETVLRSGDGRSGNDKRASDPAADLEAARRAGDGAEGQSGAGGNASDPSLKGSTETYAGAALTPGGVETGPGARAQGAASPAANPAPQASGALPFAEINNPPTAAPVAIDGASEDQSFIIRASDLLSGANDPDGETLKVSKLSVDPASGELVDNGDGTWTFTPNANFNGAVSFTYTVTDGTASATSTASLNVAAVNDGPVATALNLGGMQEDGSFVVRAADLLAGASDLDGDTLRVSGLSVDPAQGALTNNGDGIWTFTPNANFNGAVSFTYTVTDGVATASSTASLNVAAVNDAPADLRASGPLAVGETVLQAGAGVAAYDPSGVVVATLSATDADGDPIRYVLASDPSGKFEIVGNEVRVKQGAVIDFETDQRHDLVVRAYDAAGAFSEQAFTVQVLDREGVYAGTGASNTVYGSSEEDTMRGAGGNDRLFGRAGNDALYGEAGNDTLQGDEGDDLLDGGAGNDTLIGGAGSDRLFGQDGNDLLRGGAGADALNGGAGTDTADYTGSAGAVTVNLATGAASGGDAQGDTFVSIENVTGGAGADTLTGDAGANVLTGGAGDDRIDGGAGNDTLRGGVGADILLGGSGNDTLQGEAGDDRLEGGDGNDSLTGGAGADALLGGAGTDTASYSAATAGVTVNLATGLGSGGDAQGDTFVSIENVTGGAGADTLTGDAGANTLSGGGGNDRLDGAEGNDTLRGGDANDTVLGGLGNDSLFGDAGDDTIVGGAGADTIQGGAGFDTAVFSGNRADYTITYNAANAQYTIAHKNGGADGTDRVTTVERFQFADRTITVTDPTDLLNHAPTVGAVALTGGAEDTSFVIRASDILAGATDFEGDALSVTALSVNPAHGTLVNNNNGTWTFTPAANFNGSASFNYTVSDGTLSSSSTASLNVAAVNDGPVATAVNLGGMQEDGSFVVRASDLLAGASDLDGDTLRVAGLSVDPAQGALTNNGDGTWTFTPNANFNGNVSFTYTVTDGTATATSPASLNVAAVNDGPSNLGFNGVSVGEGAAVGAVVGVASATDIDAGDVLRFSFAPGQDAGGRFTIDAATGEVKVAPGLNFEANTSHDVTIRVTDSAGAVQERAYTITVNDAAENLTLSAGDDVFADTNVTELSIDGGAGNDRITGTANADNLRGGFGNDTLSGGDGNDALVGDGGTMLINGSFESTAGMTQTGWGFSGSTTEGWTREAGPSLEVVNSGHGGVAASDGSKWMDLDASPGNVTISQVVQGVQSGETYELSFDAASRAAAGSGGLQVFFGGQLLGTIEPGRTMANYSFEVVGGSGDGSNKLAFVGTGTADNVGASLDNVRFGSGGDDLLDGGAGNDTLTGGAGSDTLLGGAGNDVLNGGFGADMLTGGAGDDRLVGGGGTDRAVFSGAVGDYSFSVNANGETVVTDLRSGAPDGTDTLTGVETVQFSDGTLNLVSGAFAATTLAGSNGADLVVGGAGNDTITAGAGADIVSAGAGDDRVFAASGEANLLVNGSFEQSAYSGAAYGAPAGWTVGGTANSGGLHADSSRASAGPQYYAMGGWSGQSGGTLAQTITTVPGQTYTLTFDIGVHYGSADGALKVDALSGSDVIMSQTATDAAGGGNSTYTFTFTATSASTTIRFTDITDMSSGGDRDVDLDNVRLVMNDGADKMDGGAGVDTLDYSRSSAAVDVNLSTGQGAGGEAEGDRFVNFENVTGSSYSDRLTGDAGANALDGGDGNDTLVGGGGADTLTGGAGVDTADYSGSGAGVTVDLATGQGSGGDAQGDRLSGVENLKGSSQNDTLTGDANANTLDGGAGDDRLDGGAGNDTLLGGAGTDQLFGGDGADRLNGGAGADQLDGGAGDDVMEGDQNLLFNGNFEVGTYSGGAFGTPEGWTKGGTANSGGLHADSGRSSDGAQYYAMGGWSGASGGTLSQTVQTVAGETYALTFDIGVNWGGAGAVGTLQVDALSGSNLIMSQTASDTLGGGRSAFTFTFTATSATTTIQFTDISNMATGGDRDVDLDNIRLTANNGGADTLTGGDGADSLYGDGGNDALSGGAGNDSLFGGTGDDRLAGGAGNDRLLGGDGTDTAVFSGNRADYTVTYDAATGQYTIVHKNGGADGTDTVSGVERFEFADGIVADPQSLLNTAPTDIALSAAAVVEDAAAGTVVGTASGTDANAGDTLTYSFAPGQDAGGRFTIDAATGELKVAPGGGISFETAQSHDVTIRVTDASGASFDKTFTVSVGDQAEGLALTSGDDTITDIGVTETFIDGGAGNDTITGTANADDLRGDAGNDTLNGGAGNDVLSGGAGDDTLNGGAGADTLYDGQGADLVDGGDGSDTIVLDAIVGTSGTNTIADTGATGVDTLVLQNGTGQSFDVQANFSAANSGIEIIDGTQVSGEVLQANGAALNFDLSGVTLNGVDAIQGTGAVDSVIGSSGADTVYAGAGNDTISGGAGDDRLYGEAGDDKLTGGAGADTISGGDGADSIDGGAGNDSLDGGAGNDWIMAGDGNNTVQGGAGNDVIDDVWGARMTASNNFDGGAGDDTVYGGDGNDVVSGGVDNDRVYGEGGDDRIYGDAQADDAATRVAFNGDGSFDGVDVKTGNEAYISFGGAVDNASINLATGDGTPAFQHFKVTAFKGGVPVGTVSVDVYGGDTAVSLDFGAGVEFDSVQVEAQQYDWWTGDYQTVPIAGQPLQVSGVVFREHGAVGGNDLLVGEGGNDRMYGGAGNDQLNGDAGNDILVGGMGADALNGGDGFDTVDYSGSAVGVTAVFENTDKSGIGLSDSLTAGGVGGDAQGDTYSGVEKFVGTGFNDRVYGSSAGMTAELGKGDDVFDNSASATGVDTVNAGDGDDKVFVGGGNDVVDGGAGDDQIDGEAGNDTLAGGAGQDYIQGGTGADTIDGGQGHDRLFGQDGDDAIRGGDGYDQLFGEAGNDTLNGGAEGDYLDGGAGNDILAGGTGNDWVNGGDGSDMLLFGLGDGADFFSGGAGGGYVDEIQLNIDASAMFGSDWTLTLTSGSIAGMGDHEIFLSGDAAGVITLKDGSTIQFDQTEQLSWGG